MATVEVNNPPSLPSYPQLIINAIQALNDKNGSNKTSISKYIESKYGVLPGGHTTLLSHHLNRMKETGELIFWKNNYIIPDPNAPPRRGRGRPPKSKDPNAPPSSPKPKAAFGTGKPRGRPRKMARPEGGIGIDGSSSTMMMGTARPRGRPPKVKDSVFTEVSVGN